MKMITKIAFAIVVTITMNGQSLAQSTNRLPPDDAFDLTGQSRRLPAELPTAPTLIVVAFERNQQPIIDRLFKLIEDAEIAKQGIATIETPVIQNPGGVGRFFIDNGMRSGIRDIEKQKVVITLYVDDISAWLAQTGLGTKKTVYLMAVDRSGRILQSARAEKIADVKAMKAFVSQAKR